METIKSLKEEQNTSGSQRQMGRRRQRGEKSRTAGFLVKMKGVGEKRC